MSNVPLTHGVRQSVWRVCARLALALGIVAVVSPAGAAPLISGGVWFEARSIDCTSTISCALPFTAVPGGKTLVARKLSCRLVLPTTGTVIQYFTIGGGSGGTTFLPVGPPQSPRIYFVNLDILRPFAAASVPSVRLAVTPTASVLSLACSLSGDLKP